jgi:hypothetical protein
VSGLAENLLPLIASEARLSGQTFEFMSGVCSVSLRHLLG